MQENRLVSAKTAEETNLKDWYGDKNNVAGTTIMWPDCNPLCDEFPALKKEIVLTNESVSI